MKTFKRHIKEARKNPDKNPRIGAFEKLEKYMHDPKYFFTFTTLKKVGINPRSRYNTPNGIYTYPADAIVKNYGLSGDFKRLPYDADMPYIHVIEVSNNKGVMEVNSYTNSHYNRDMQKIRKFYMELYQKKFGKTLPKNDSMVEVIERIIVEAKEQAFPKNAFGYFWNTCKKLTGEGWLDAITDWKGTKGRDDIKKVWSKQQQAWVEKYVMRSALTSGAQGWNNLMRHLGYNGFVDRTGKGWIHQNEKTQAVFLSMKGLKVVEMVLNKNYERLKAVSDTPKEWQFLSKENNKFGPTLKKYAGFKDDPLTFNYFQKILKAFKIKDTTIGYKDGQISFTGGIIRGHSLDKKELERVNPKFIKCSIHAGNFNHCVFEDCVASPYSAENSFFIGDTMIGSGKFSKIFCKGRKVEIRGGVFVDSSFNETLLKNGTFNRSKLYMAHISDGSIYQCNVKDSAIHGGDFRECDVNGGGTRIWKIGKADRKTQDTMDKLPSHSKL